MSAQGRPSLYPGANPRKRYDNTKNVSRFAPGLRRIEPETEVSKSFKAATPYFQAFQPGKSFGRSIPKPVLNLEASPSQMTALEAARKFRENISLSPSKIVTNPHEVEQSLVRSYASIAGDKKLGRKCSIAF